MTGTPDRSDEEVARRNATWAAELIGELVRGGLRTVVIAPGSRSGPLVFAAARHPAVRTLVQIDERSAAFLALGVGKASGRPAAVITTSGTAVANLLPAVVEAAQSESPLILLTADRPPRLRGLDANQAIDQAGIFGGYVRYEIELSPLDPDGASPGRLRSSVRRAMAFALGDPAGPVHLNLPFEKPLEPPPGFSGPRDQEDPPGRPPPGPRPAVPPQGPLRELLAGLQQSARPLLVAGRLPRPGEAGPALASLARATGMPLLADPLSGARFTEGGGAIGGYDLILESDALRSGLRPDRVVRFGASPTSTRLLSFLADLPGVPHTVVDGGRGRKDHQRIATSMVHGAPGQVARSLEAGWSGPSPARQDWLKRWKRLEARAAETVVRSLEARPCEAGVLVEIVRRCPAEHLLFVSSSMPVRDLDSFGLPGLRPEGAPLAVLGNRGASGIDGIVSTAIGAGIGAERAVTAVVGDLALLHDSNGLLALRESGVRLTLVVVNNDGGGIFSLLPVREHEPEFTRFFSTPHGREPGRVAALHDLGHRRVDLRSPAGSLDALRDGLEWATRGPESRMLEIRTDREESRRLRDRAVQEVREVLESTDPLDGTG